jgi:outer membrane protein assembly factor BamA
VNALDLTPTLTVVIAGVNGISGRQISETGYMRIAPGDIGRQVELAEQRRLEEQRLVEQQRRLAEQQWLAEQRRLEEQRRRGDSQSDSAGEWSQGKPIQDIVFEGLHSIKASELDGLMKPFIGVLFNNDVFWEIQGRLYALEYFVTITPSAVPADPTGSALILRFRVAERTVESNLRKE